jgi:hypothetical protein
MNYIFFILILIIIIMEGNISEIIKVKFDPKSKNSGVSGVANSEYLLRMNFLNQATTIVKNSALKRFYASEIKNIAKRNVLRT